MALLASKMTDLGSSAPPFELANANPQVGGSVLTFDSAAGKKATVIVFMCNHCPYVKVIEERLIALAHRSKDKGINFVGICSNDPDKYPEDSFESMARIATDHSYPFPYLHDLSQEIAVAYGAECTPDFFVFDSTKSLIYRGRLDDGTPGRPHSSAELENALEAVVEGNEISDLQHPSIGCNIKWRNPRPQL